MIDAITETNVFGEEEAMRENTAPSTLRLVRHSLASGPLSFRLKRRCVSETELLILFQNRAIRRFPPFIAGPKPQAPTRKRSFERAESVPFRHRRLAISEKDIREKVLGKPVLRIELRLYAPKAHVLPLYDTPIIVFIAF